MILSLRSTLLFFMITLVFAVSVFWTGIWSLMGFFSALVFWYFVIKHFG